MPELNNYLEQPPGWEPGIYQLDTYEQYAAIKALRSSELKKLKKSPAHYRAAALEPKIFSAIQERTLAKGKAFDVLTLHGPEAFENLVVVEPELNRATKIYKEWKADHAGAECILSATEKKQIMDMHAAAMKKKRFSEIFGGAGYPHRVIIWQCRRTGLWCKAEIDWICADSTVVDLKSTADAGFWFFSRNAYRLGYLNQAAFYLDGLTHITGIAHERFMFAAVEVDPPHESHVFRGSVDQLERNQSENEDLMWTLKACLETDEWPGYPDEIMDLDSGHYLYDDEFENDEMGESVNGF